MDLIDMIGWLALAWVVLVVALGVAARLSPRVARWLLELGDVDRRA